MKVVSKRAIAPKPLSESLKKGAVPKGIASIKKVTDRNGFDGHPAYGTSKLEDEFAEKFLDRLSLEYDRQFEAKSIGRYYDFIVGRRDPVTGKIVKGKIVEVDGSYYHGDPRVLKEGKMTGMQMKNHMVDQLKNEWALANGYPLIRIWEYDIKHDPSGVMKRLMEEFRIPKTYKLKPEKPKPEKSKKKRTTASKKNKKI